MKHVPRLVLNSDPYDGTAVPGNYPRYSRRLILRQADQARSNFAAIESDLQFVMAPLAPLPDRAYVTRLVAMATAGIIRHCRCRGAPAAERALSRGHSFCSRSC
jgi:hypothetical protein